MKFYNKIETLYERDFETKKLIEGKFRNSTVEYLKDNIWQFTEKVDGTNIIVNWDGHKVNFYGRTEKAIIPTPLLEKLTELFGGLENEELFEQKFGEHEVSLYGAGYGPKIQNGGLYRDDVNFILFDVMINENYQPRETVEDVAKYFNIDTVPILFEGTLQEGVDYVKKHPNSVIAKHEKEMEGLVARPKIELKTRTSERIIVKIKWEDFKLKQKEIPLL